MRGHDVRSRAFRCHQLLDLGAQVLHDEIFLGRRLAVIDFLRPFLKWDLDSEFLVDPRGRLVRKRVWSSPAQLRKDLEQLVGPVASPTQVSDLNLKTLPPPEAAARGVAGRLGRSYSAPEGRDWPIPSDPEIPLSRESFSQSEAF